MADYTFDTMWAELKNRDGEFYTKVEMLTDWIMSKPHWWQFRKRRAWRKAEPKFRRSDNATD